MASTITSQFDLKGTPTFLRPLTSNRPIATRPALDAALVALKAGDVLVVWKLDRLGRSLAHLITLVSDLSARGIGFVSLSEAIDTSCASGRLLFHVMGALAEFERSLISGANARGYRGGP
ncbi:MAG: recombinase family protein [Hyphomicrobium sp.]